MSRLSVLALLALFAAAPARAQVAEPPADVLRPGAWALSFALPWSGGGGELGYWRVQSPAQRIGLFLSLDGEYTNTALSDPEGDASGSDADLEVALGPVLRRYLRTEGVVRPFGQVDLAAGYSYFQRDRSGVMENDGYGVLGRVGAGIGLEWFPLRQVSVSGYTGARLSTRYMQSRHRDPQRPVLIERWQVGAETLSSVLVLTIFLPPRS